MRASNPTAQIVTALLLATLACSGIPLEGYVDLVGREVTIAAGQEQTVDGALIIASPKLHDEIQSRLRGKYTTEIHALRPAVLRTLYIQDDLWEAYMAGRR